MPPKLEIARLNDDGVLVAVEVCSPNDYRNDPISRTVQLEPGNDMRERLNTYRFDWAKFTFVPLSQEPLDAAEQDTSELVEGMIETIEDVTDYLIEIGDPDTPFELSDRARRTIREWRRKRPRRQLRTKKRKKVVRMDCVVVTP